MEICLEQVNELKSKNNLNKSIFSIWQQNLYFCIFLVLPAVKEAKDVNFTLYIWNDGCCVDDDDGWWDIFMNENSWHLMSKNVYLSKIDWQL